MSSWDRYFLNICNAVSSKSPCLSRQIGVVLVRDHSVVSTGYNGPPRGFPHCAPVSISTSNVRLASVASIAPGKLIAVEGPIEVTYTHACPRRAKGYKSGEGLHECPAAHAETNAIANAARLGVCISGTTLYMNTKEVPCKDCMALTINAGIVEIVTLESIPYHEISLEMAKVSKIHLRRFEV